MGSYCVSHRISLAHVENEKDLIILLRSENKKLKDELNAMEEDLLASKDTINFYSIFLFKAEELLEKLIHNKKLTNLNNYKVKLENFYNCINSKDRDKLKENYRILILLLQDDNR